MTFFGLHLETHDLTGLNDFYVNRLELNFLEETDVSFAVQVGRTKLGFEKADQDVRPIYRFTIAVPLRHFAAAVDRMSSRIHLLRHQGQTIFDLPTGNARAVYAHDPAGNIVEFASRTSTDESYTWGITQIGMPVDNLDAASNYLMEHLELPPHARITAVDKVVIGDGTYSFLFVKSGSVWFPSEKLAQIHHISATVPGKLYARIKVLENPYYINRAMV